MRPFLGLLASVLVASPLLAGDLATDAAAALALAPVAARPKKPVPPPPPVTPPPSAAASVSDGPAAGVTCVGGQCVISSPAGSGVTFVPTNAEPVRFFPRLFRGRAGRCGRGGCQ